MRTVIDIEMEHLASFDAHRATDDIIERIERILEKYKEGREIRSWKISEKQLTSDLSDVWENVCLSADALPPGTYIMVDPCYVPQAEALYILETYSDGTHQDENGRKYSVDSGRIGVFDLGINLPDHGGWHKVTIDKSWVPVYNQDDGIIRFEY